MTAVETGILPLKLDSGADQRELDRAKLLIASLKHFWRGDRPFRLHVVLPDDEKDAAAAALGPYSGGPIRLQILSEREFFEENSRFFRMRGMYKQQTIKLFVPAFLSIGPFVTFDADVVCIKPFDETSFVRDDRLASTWEPKSLHSWWQNAMSGLGLPSNLDEPGLGVTPNILHSDICADIVRYFEQRGPEPLADLYRLAECEAPPHKLASERMALAWSEYSLYTLIGELTPRLYRHHLRCSQVAAAGIEILSRRSVWSAERVGRLAPDASDPAHFLVVQSWAGVPVEDIAARCGLDFT